MSGTPSVTAIGSVSIAADTADVNALFQSVAATINALPASDKFTYNGNTIPPASGDGHSVLFVPATVNATVTVPAGYGYVVVAQGSHATLVTGELDTSGPSKAVVVGDGFNFTGSASVVASGGGVSSIASGQNFSASLERVDGTGTVVAGFQDTIVASGGQHTIVAQSGGHLPGETVSVAGQATATITMSKTSLFIANGGRTTVAVGELSASNIQVGTFGVAPPLPPPPPTTPGAHAAAAPGFTNKISTTLDPSRSPAFSVANKFTITDAASVNLISLGTNDTVDASAGASTIFGVGGDSLTTSNAASLFFVGGTGVSTIHGGGSANVTLFATTGQQFDVGASQQNVFVGGTAASTINGNANGGGGSFFGGTHGDVFNSGTGPAQVFVGLGGSDTVNSGAGATAPLTYAENAEKMTLTGAAATTIVAFTSGGQVDASRTTGNNDVFAGFGGGGNQTLIGSGTSLDATGNATHDTFVVGANPTLAQSTITIDNWHGGDVLYLAGFQPFDSQTMDAAIGGSLAMGAKGDLSFRLSDNTTISFVGNHPTNFAGNSAF